MNSRPSIPSLFRLLQFTTGRRLFAYSQVLKLLHDVNAVRLQDFVEQGIQKDRALLAAEARYRKKRAADKLPRGKLRRLDHRVDRSVGALHTHLRNIMEIDPGSQEASTAERVSLELFPEGAAPVTRLSFEDELARCEELVGRAQGDLSSDLEAIGATLLVDKLDKHVRAFAAELRKLPQSTGPSWDTLCVERAAAQTHLERFVAKVYADDELTQAQRTTLLDPVMRQNEDISAHYSRRRSVPDVDPQTGEEVDESPEEPSESEN